MRGFFLTMRRKNSTISVKIAIAFTMTILKRTKRFVKKREEKNHSYTVHILTDTNKKA
jgi:hypothetical protein